MPDLDVTDILSDPDFCETLTIKRRAQTVGTNGRASTTTTTISPPPVGVVQPVSDQPLVRGPDQQNLPRLLEVHTPFRLRSASRSGGVTYQPDILVWNGDDYIVNKVQDWSRYGAGWVQADCSSIASTDAAPV